MATSNSLIECQLPMPLCRNRSSPRRAKCTNGRRRRSVERKVRTLKKLIPNCESMGVERLFTETAEYIVALQRRVKLMQTVVDALSSASDDQ